MGAAGYDAGPSGDDGTRTHNPLLAKQVRYQLRHGPWDRSRGGGLEPVEGALKTQSSESVTSAHRSLSVLPAETWRHTA